MKKIIILLFIALFAITKSNAQTTAVTDTLAYLKSIEANKALYIGQPFSVLMDSLKINIKFFSPFASIPYDKNKETSTSFSFYFPQNAEEIYLTYPSLEIYWLPYLNDTQSRTLSLAIAWQTN
jgi:hypothetical protein